MSGGWGKLLSLFSCLVLFPCSRMMCPPGPCCFICPCHLHTPVVAATPQLPAATCCCRFTTHTGTVAAADDWDTPVQLKAVRKSMPGSYEHLFHK